MTQGKLYIPVSMKLTDTYDRIVDKLFSISGYRSVYDNRIYAEGKWSEYEDIIDGLPHFVIDTYFEDDEIKYLKRNYRLRLN